MLESSTGWTGQYPSGAIGEDPCMDGLGHHLVLVLLVSGHFSDALFQDLDFII